MKTCPQSALVPLLRPWIDLDQQIYAAKIFPPSRGSRKEKAVKQINLGRAGIATAVFACAALFSFSWSERGGVSLSIESVQARVGRPLTPVSVAGVARRQDRRAAYAYGAGRYGGSSNNRPGLVGGADAGTYSPAAYGAYGSYGGYGSYAAAPACTPGTLYMSGGLVQRCK